MRSTLTSTNIARTSLINDMESDEKSLRRSNLDKTVQSNKDIEKEEDYNDLFYNDYEKTTKRKLSHNYEDIKDPDDEKSLDSGFNSTDYANNVAESKTNSVLSQSSVNDDEDYDDNGLGSCTGKNKTTTVTKTRIYKTIENVQHKRNPVCSVLKLRPLAFNSPLTLHEVFVCQFIFHFLNRNCF